MAGGQRHDCVPCSIAPVWLGSTGTAPDWALSPPSPLRRPWPARWRPCERGMISACSAPHWSHARVRSQARRAPEIFWCNALRWSHRADFRPDAVTASSPAQGLPPDGAEQSRECDQPFLGSDRDHGLGRCLPPHVQVRHGGTCLAPPLAVFRHIRLGHCDPVAHAGTLEHLFMPSPQRMVCIRDRDIHESSENQAVDHRDIRH